jgi:hypothetical protein
VNARKLCQASLIDRAKDTQQYRDFDRARGMKPAVTVIAPLRVMARIKKRDRYGVCTRLVCDLGDLLSQAVRGYQIKPSLVFGSLIAVRSMHDRRHLNIE